MEFGQILRKYCNMAEDYKALAQTLKDEANVAFQSGAIEESINLYSQAIAIDPDNHVLYSNRAAAYMKVDSKSKALKDAERCVELAPTWSKGYSRLGAAQQSLKRYEQAIETYKAGLKLDASNTALWSSLSACQEAFDKDKQQRFAEASIERQQEEERLRKLDEAKQKQIEQPSEQELENQRLSDFLSEINGSSSSGTPSAPSSSAGPTAARAEADLLSGFFSEVTTAQDTIKAAATGPTKIESKYANQELGDAKYQFDRLTQKNYEWRNLNPFYVMQLGTDATDEDIRQRYKNLSRRVHPDKMLGMENAREAFEQVHSSPAVPTYLT